MTNLNALADRVEEARGGDRLLDAAIADALRWWPAGFSRKDAHGPDRRWCDDRRVSSRIPDRIDCPAWTSSVDAALTLCPAWLAPTIVGHERTVRLLNGLGLPVGGSDYRSRAETIPLAIVAACLRARATGGSHG